MYYKIYRESNVFVVVGYQSCTEVTLVYWWKLGLP